MRRLLVVLSVLVFLTSAVSTATAQNTITLGGSTAAVTFTGTGGGNWTLSLGTLTGTAEGFGIFTSGPAPYSITQAATTTITGTLTSKTATSATWSITQSAPLKFSYGTGGSLLTGNLELVNLSVSGKTGNFDTTLEVDLTDLGGSLAPLFSSVGAKVQLTIQYKGSGTLLAALEGLGTGTLSTGLALSGGEILRTPEPASMLLVGAGLLVLGTLFRRRRRNA
jgi:hypothetical protein